MRSSIRRSTPGMGDRVQSSRAAWIAARALKSELRFTPFTSACVPIGVEQHIEARAACSDLSVPTYHGLGAANRGPDPLSPSTGLAHLRCRVRQKGASCRISTREARIPMTGRSMDPERASARVQAIAEALGRLGEPITEAQAREIATRQECECQDGMFALAPTRRGLLGSAGLVAAVGATAMLPHPTFAKAPPGAAEYQVMEDPTKEPGRLMGVDGGYGSRSQFETDVRWVNPTRTASFTPLQASYGTITPSGLHYERHHAGIPNIDPARHRLVV